MRARKWGGGRATAVRRKLQEIVDRGEAVCSKCGRAVTPPTPWDVDHRVNRDQAPGLTWEPSNWAIAHRACNRAAGARYGNRKRGISDRPKAIIPPPSRSW